MVVVGFDEDTCEMMCIVVMCSIAFRVDLLMVTRVVVSLLRLSLML